MKPVKLLVFLILIGLTKSYGKDIRGAYMQLTWVTAYTYNVNLFLFTDVANNINRPMVSIDMGDAAIITCTLSTITAINGINVKKYSGTHTYSGQGTYYLSYLDTFRIAGIKNILNSQTQKIKLTSYFVVSSISGPNSNPTLQNFPIYFGLNGSQAFFNPNFKDIDGDSLYYPALIPCYTNPTSDYYIPNGATLNNKGVVSFSKDSLGLYSFSYQITELRKDLSNNYNTVGWSVIDFIMDINSSIGINKLSFSNPIKIYPNPVLNTLRIESEQYFEAGTEIEITNTLGQTVLKRSFNKEIDLTQFSSGYYTLKIISPNSAQIISKFIKD